MTSNKTRALVLVAVMALSAVAVGVSFTGSAVAAPTDEKVINANPADTDTGGSTDATHTLSLFDSGYSGVDFSSGNPSVAVIYEGADGEIDFGASAGDVTVQVIGSDGTVDEELDSSGNTVNQFSDSGDVAIHADFGGSGPGSESISNDDTVRIVVDNIEHNDASESINVKAQIYDDEGAGTNPITDNTQDIEVSTTLSLGDGPVEVTGGNFQFYSSLAEATSDSGLSSGDSIRVTGDVNEFQSQGASAADGSGNLDLNAINPSTDQLTISGSGQPTVASFGTNLNSRPAEVLKTGSNSGITIENITFDGSIEFADSTTVNADTAITIGDGNSISGLTVRGNTFTGFGSSNDNSILDFSSVTSNGIDGDLTVESNTIDASSAGSAGTGISIDAQNANDGDNVISVAKNDIDISGDGPTGLEIVQTDVSSTTNIDDNIITGDKTTGSDGIEIDGSNGPINALNNTIENAGTAVLHDGANNNNPAGDVTFDRLNVTDYATDGISVTTSGSTEGAITLENSLIQTGNGNDAINIDESSNSFAGDITISNTTIRDLGDARGLALTGGSNLDGDLTINQGTVFNNSGDTAFESQAGGVFAGNVNIDNIEIRNHDQAAHFDVTGNQLTVTDVTIDNVDAAEHGDYVFNADGGTSTAVENLTVNNITAANLGNNLLDTDTGTSKAVVSVTDINVENVSNRAGSPFIAVSDGGGFQNSPTLSDIAITNVTSGQSTPFISYTGGAGNTIDSVSISNIDASDINSGATTDVLQVSSDTNDVSISDVTVDNATGTTGIDIANVDNTRSDNTVTVSNTDINGTRTGVLLADGGIAEATVDTGDLTNITTEGISINNLASSATADVSSFNINKTTTDNGQGNAIGVAPGSTVTVNVTESTFGSGIAGAGVDFQSGTVTANVKNNDFNSEDLTAVNEEGGLSSLNTTGSFFGTNAGPNIAASTNRFSPGADVNTGGLASSNLDFRPFVDANDNNVFTLEGTINTPDGNALTNTEVDFEFFSQSTGATAGTFTLSSTGGSGQYVAVAESAGTYTAVADTAGFAQTDETNSFFIDPTTFTSSRDITLDLTSSAEVNGTAFGPDGEKLDGVSLSLLDANDGSTLATDTASSGDFAFQVSPLNNDDVLVTSANNPNSSTETISVDSGSAVSQNFTLGGEVTGTVNFPNGTAVDSRTITFQDSSGTDLATNETTENGTYTINLSAGDFNIRANLANFDPSDTQSVTVTEGENVTQDFSLSELATAQLTTTIKNGSGSVVTNTDVNLTAINNPPGTLDTTVTTDSNGQASVRIPASDPPASYDIIASADGFADSEPVGFAPTPGESLERNFTVEEDAAESASVTFNDQSVQNGTEEVTVASANYTLADGSEGDYVVVMHVVNDDGSISNPVGASSDQTGSASDITVDLNNTSAAFEDDDALDTLTENTTLRAMLHETSNDSAFGPSLGLATDDADITVTPESPLDGPAGDFDTDGDGDIGILELGDAGTAFAQGDLTIGELGEIGAEFAS